MTQVLEVGARRRATLTNIGHHDRYLAEELPDGTVVLHPAVVMSEAQARLMSAPELMKKLTSANGPSDSELVRRPRRPRRNT